MEDIRDVVNKIHNACEWGSFETADETLKAYSAELVKTAERLASIKALEEVRELFLSNGSKVTTMVKLERMIKELKESKQMIYMQEIEIAPDEKNPYLLNKVVGITIKTFDTIEERNEYVKNFKPYTENTTIFKDVKIGEKLVIR